ncbi:MAG: amidohydrolase family protein [Gammaproteobacteria bacterium]
MSTCAGPVRSGSAAVRARLDHPVIDSDGHLTEYRPVFMEYLRDVGGAAIAARFQSAVEAVREDPAWIRQSPAERLDARTPRPVFWGVPTRNTADLASVYLPDLLYERLDEYGLDFTVLFPGLGMTVIHIEDEEVRRAACRALNRYYAEIFGTHPDRMAPVAVIPMHTPAEAIKELEYAVRTLKLRAVLVPSHVRRPIAAIARAHPAAAREAFWIDTYGLDSEHDYDPFWARCVELKVVPAFHSRSFGWTNHRSVSNYVYNHVGHFADSAEALCKSLFLGGVPRRFPDLRLAFLEGGIGWARSLLSDLVGHWRKRNYAALEDFNPRNLDTGLARRLVQQYGGRLAAGRTLPDDFMLPLQVDSPARSAALDDFARCGIATAADIGAVFSANFHFGCEADDPVTASAFDAHRNPLRLRMNAVFGSDIGHWDVPDMSAVLAEAWEPVEEGTMTAGDFRDFVFANPVRMWAGANPEFFKGTVVEAAAAKLLGGG